MYELSKEPMILISMASKEQSQYNTKLEYIRSGTTKETIEKIIAH